MRRGIPCLIAGVVLGAVLGSASAGDPPQQQFWSGRLADKTKTANLTQPAAAATDAKSASDPKQNANQPPQLPPGAREPEWLRRMDKNERSTLTGGWALQNWSGGTQSQTSRGDRQGYYSPNNYQGAQFQQWNNVATRQNTPSWNGSTQLFSQQMWSQGYVSPINYAGPGVQSWTNMSAGTISPNPISGGWIWR